MIPKIIHLCWFGGGDYSAIMKKCLATIEEFLPEYDVMLWNEDNFNVDERRFTREAYLEKKYAFVSDVCRLQALKNYGGVYLDTDVEIKKSLDSFLAHEFFIGMESDVLVCTAVMGSVKGYPLIDELLKYYSTKSFYRYPMLKFIYKKMNTKPNTVIIAKLLLEKGFKRVNVFQELPSGVVIYPSEYFSPIDYKTLKFTSSDNTFAIHHFTNTWK